MSHIIHNTQSDFQLSDFLETLPDLLFVVDDEQSICYANLAAERRMGINRRDLVGNSLWQSAPFLCSLELYQALVQVIQKRQPLSLEYASPLLPSYLQAQLLPASAGVMISIHEQEAKLAPPKLSQTNEDLPANIIKHLPITMITLTRGGIVLSFNQTPPGNDRLRAEIIGKHLEDLRCWSERTATRDQVRAALDQAKRGEIAHFTIRPDPEVDSLLDRVATITPHVSEEGSIDYLIYLSADFPARKSSEDELRAFVDAIPQFVWIGRPDGFIEYHNQRWHDYTKIPPELSDGDNWNQCLHPDDQQLALSGWYTALQNAGIYEREEQVRDGVTGDYRWFLLRSAPYIDAQGEIIKWIGTLTDIDEQKQIEEKLRASEEQWNMLAETVPQLVWATRPDGFLEYWNSRFSDYLQAESESMHGHNWRQFVHPEDLARVIAIRTRSLETGEPYDIEYRLKDGRTGGYRWFLVRGAPVRDTTGKITRWFGTSTNIEDQKHLEEVLRQNQERIQALMESTIMGIVIIEDEKLVAANDAFFQMTGYSQEDLRDGLLNLSLLRSPETSTPDSQAVEELETFQQVKPYETACVCKDGSILPILAGIVALPHHPSQVIGLMLDNSARKELEQRKDDFISIASHELRTPLTSLQLQVQLLARQLARQNNVQAAPALARIEKQVKHLERLVAAFLDVSKIQAGKLEYLQESVDIDELIHDLAEAMQQIPPAHTIIVRGATATTLLADRDRLRQVFTNLISNAIKYSPQNYPVIVELSSSPEAVMIDVRDQGIGIPREQREKIFERFYRAVPSSQKVLPGLGMGLYVTAEIVKHYKGSIHVESAKGKGSTFRVTLPSGHKETTKPTLS